MNNTSTQYLRSAYLNSVMNASSKVLHDIRSPLGSLDVALNSIDEKTDQSVQLIRSAVERIKEVIKDLESLQEPKSSSCESSTVNINKMVNEILMAKSAEYFKRNISFVNQTRLSGEKLIAKVDGGDFKRIISNMINNSVEAITGKQGSVQCRVYRKRDTLHIRIEDNGGGVPERIKGSLFQGGRTCGKKSGRGLGLSTAREKLRAWRGDIKLFTSDATGTIFHIQIPAFIGPPFQKFLDQQSKEAQTLGESGD